MGERKKEKPNTVYCIPWNLYQNPRHFMDFQCILWTFKIFEIIFAASVKIDYHTYKWFLGTMRFEAHFNLYLNLSELLENKTGLRPVSRRVLQTVCQSPFINRVLYPVTIFDTVFSNPTKLNSCVKQVTRVIS